MKLTTLLVMVLGLASVILACTSVVSAVPFDGESDVDITDHAGYLGASVANAGDLNNDGYTDLVMGAHSDNMAYVYYGGPSFDRFSDLDIADHAGESGFGRSVASAGDLNNDGYADLVIGANGANKAFVYYGGPDFDWNSDVTIDDHAGESKFGTSVANVDISSEEERKPKNTPKNKKSKTKKDKIKIDRVVVCEVDKDILPDDAVFKGYQDVVVQEIVIKTDNIVCV
ncbi:MAG: hypothetical protein C5S49_07765 [Candidatus Methanogaster sp.]|nr:MAG: hypothetical protein C5S49_07765 [ANME-2 cluster archaeon]